MRSGGEKDKENIDVMLMNYSLLSVDVGCREETEERGR